MAEVNWRRTFAISSLIFALLLVGAAIFLHVRHKQHLGRMPHATSVDAAIVLTTKTPTTTEAPTTTATTTTTTTPTADTTDQQIEESTSVTPKNDLVNIFVDLLFAMPKEFAPSNDTIFNEKVAVQNFEHSMKKLTNFMFAELGTKKNDSTTAAPTTNTKTLSSLQILKRSLAGEQNVGTKAPPILLQVSNECLQCICVTVSECRPVTCSSGAQCGLFRISQPYWLDAGMPQLADGNNSNAKDGGDRGYSHCVNNAECAQRTVRAFIGKYARDCNQDGVVDCRDHVALHLLGPGGCMKQKMLAIFERRMASCLAMYDDSSLEAVPELPVEAL